MTGSELLLGRITGVHGIKGWVKVFSHTDPMEQILTYSPWYLDKGRSRQEIKVAEGRRQGKGLIARLDNIANRNEAELLIGAEIRIEDTRLPELESGEYYWHQLEGLKVVNLDGQALGVIDHLMETGANDVMVVQPCEDSLDDRKRLIPWVDEDIVSNVDLATGVVMVNWAEDY